MLQAWRHVKTQKSPIDFAVKSLSDARTLGAILTAPPFLSGLTDAEWKLVQDRARTAFHPEQVAMQKSLRKALDDLHEGIDATRRAVCERCDYSPPSPALQLKEGVGQS